MCEISFPLKKSHQNHAIHLKSLSDTLNLCYFECMFMWYKHVYDVVRMCVYLGGTKNVWYVHVRTLLRKTRYSNPHALKSNPPLSFILTGNTVLK